MIHRASVGVMSIATGSYLEHWMRQATSVDAHLFADRDVTIILFTDRPEEARAHALRLGRVSVRVVRIESLGWPDATLLRYRIFSDHWSEVAGDVVVYLDADMLVVAPAGPELVPESWVDGIALVRHPGYYRGEPAWRLRVSHPRLIVTDLAGWVRREGGPGQWERDEASCAFVPPALRREYVCGGAWMGTRPAIEQLIGELAERTDLDSAVGITARWHDESHMNWWAATHPHTTLGPEYCFDPGAPHLKGVNPRIVAVDKNTLRITSP